MSPAEFIIVFEIPTPLPSFLLSLILSLDLSFFANFTLYIPLSFQDLDSTKDVKKFQFVILVLLSLK